MGRFFVYGEGTPPGAAEIGLVGTDVLVPAGRRAVIRRFDGWTLEPGNTRFYLNAGATAAQVTAGPPGPHVWGGAVAGIGGVGADCYVYVDALGAAVNLCASVEMSAGGVASGGSFGGIYQ